MNYSEPPIDLHYAEATHWACWRCGGSFSGLMPYEARITGCKGWIVAPVCQACVEDPLREKDLLLLHNLAWGEAPYWKLRFQLAWRILLGRRVRRWLESKRHIILERKSKG